MSAPFVAGCYALVKSQYLDLSVIEIEIFCSLRQPQYPTSMTNPSSRALLTRERAWLARTGQSPTERSSLLPRSTRGSRRLPANRTGYYHHEQGYLGQEGIRNHTSRSRVRGGVPLSGHPPAQL